MLQESAGLEFQSAIMITTDSGARFNPGAEMRTSRTSATDATDCRLEGQKKASWLKGGKSRKTSEEDGGILTLLAV